MSYSVPSQYVEEDINEDIRRSLDEDMGILESVEVLSETQYDELPNVARDKLGINGDQKNVLVRITLRHLERSITNQEANGLYEQVYSYVNKGTGGYDAQ